MSPEIKAKLSNYKYKYTVLASEYNLQLMRDSGLLQLEVYEEINGKEYVYIGTDICCDFWFYE